MIRKILALLIKIHHNQKIIMSSQAEIAQGITALSEQVKKIGEESKTTLQKVADLEAALSNQENVTPELQAAFDSLKQQVQAVDDLIPDAAPAAAADAGEAPAQA